MMRAPTRLARPALAALALSSAACSGLDPGVEYPSQADPGGNLATPEDSGEPTVGIDRQGEFKFAAKLCEGIDIRPMTQPLTQEDFSRFLAAQGTQIEPKKARSNLYWYDFPSDQKDVPLRLRLAVLDDTGGAATDLTASLHDHGPGWWGVRRSNLAVLAPKTDFDTAIAFATKHKLPCWGIVTVAGNDDAFVIPGPYSEL